MSNAQRTVGVRTGGRSARVREAILESTFAELVASGYERLSVEAVAARAGVNKTTVYRRWPTLEDLLIDALTTAAPEIAVPNTGSIETDLLEVGIDLAASLNSGIGRQLAAFVLTGGIRSARLRDATHRYFEAQAARALPSVHQAVIRGELPADCDAETLLATFRAPIFYQLMTTGDPIDESVIERAARLTLMAARAGMTSR
jgi:AcrR family transcriptional regulator